MLGEVPTPQDFLDEALDAVHFCVDEALTWHLSEGADDEDLGPTEAKVRRGRSRSLIFLFQALELGIKGRVCSVSPYLLLSVRPGEWKKAWQREDASFADLRTIDASDLVAVHDTVCSRRLPEAVKEMFETLRKVRNKATHGSSITDLSSSQIIVNALTVYRFLQPDVSFARDRVRDFEQRGAVDDKYGMVTLHLSEEAFVVRSMLTHRQAEELLGVPFKGRPYLCPRCRWAARKVGLEERNAFLIDPDTVRCVACDEETPVARGPCDNEHYDGGSCPGNVLADWPTWMSGSLTDHTSSPPAVLTCLTCGWDEVPSPEPAVEE